MPSKRTLTLSSTSVSEPPSGSQCLPVCLKSLTLGVCLPDGEILSRSYLTTCERGMRLKRQTSWSASFSGPLATTSSRPNAWTVHSVSSRSPIDDHPCSALLWQRQEGGISIPASYTSFCAPITASKAYSYAMSYKDRKNLETSYVVKLSNHDLLSSPLPVFTFSHPNR